MEKDVLEMAVTKHAGGRPTTFGIDHPCWMTMCQDISQGKSLSTSLKADGMPSYVLVMAMIKKDVAFRAMYEKAIEDRADRLAEEILELADEAIPAHLDGPSKSAWVNQKRIQVDARKWVAAKLKPKVYGDRIDVSVTDTRISVSDALKEAKQRVLTDESNIVDVAVKEMVDKE